MSDTTSDDHMASPQVFFENIVVAPTIEKMTDDGAVVIVEIFFVTSTQTLEVS